MTHLINCDTLCHKSHRVRNKMRTSEGLFSMKRFTAPQNTRSILPPIHPTKSSLRCVSGIFLLISTNWQSGHSFPQCFAGKIPKSGGTLVGTQLCLQSLVCYTLVPADAEKGLRANAASTCSAAEGCADGHGSWRSLPTQRRLAEEPTVYVPLPAVATPFLRIIAMSRGLTPSSPLSIYQSFPCFFLRSAESIVFSKLFVDKTRFLW